jgi:hypothetical protein
MYVSDDNAHNDKSLQQSNTNYSKRLKSSCFLMLLVILIQTLRWPGMTDAWSRALIQNGEFDCELSIRHLYEIWKKNFSILKNI